MISIECRNLVLDQRQQALRNVDDGCFTGVGFGD